MIKMWLKVVKPMGGGAVKWRRKKKNGHELSKLEKLNAAFLIIMLFSRRKL